MNLNTEGNVDPVVTAIRRAVEKSIRDAIEAEIVGVTRRVEERVRHSVGEIAASVLERFSMERFGTQIRIIVDFDNTQKNGL
jgi:hypothetical protein